MRFNRIQHLVDIDGHQYNWDYVVRFMDKNTLIAIMDERNPANSQSLYSPQEIVNRYAEVDSGFIKRFNDGQYWRAG